MANEKDSFNCGDTVVVVSSPQLKYPKYRIWQKRLMTDGSFIYRLSGDGFFDGCFFSFTELKKVEG